MIILTMPSFVSSCSTSSGRDECIQINADILKLKGALETSKEFELQRLFFAYNFAFLLVCDI